MRYIATGNSDIGISKKVNQDAVSIKVAKTGCGEVVFAVLCDGMGGFKQGEVASASVVNAYNRWFTEVFLKSVDTMDKTIIYSEWEQLAKRLNERIYIYGKSHNFRIGTTLTAILMYKEKYFIMNIGDGRAYELYQNIVQLTKDHSWVQREVEEGRMTKEQARCDRRKNRILRCIGATNDVKPDFFCGNVKKDAIYMLCSDGIRNKVEDEELLYLLHPTCLVDEAVMNNNMKYIFELNKLRNETDNMSLILIRAVESTLVIYDSFYQSAPVLEKDIVIAESSSYIMTD